MKRRSILLCLGAVAVSFVIGLIVGRANRETVEIEKPYPVTVEKPVPVHDTVYETRTVYLPKVKIHHDTIDNSTTTTVYVHDTVQVQVPISRKEYEETINDVYVKATVSGFMSNLDELTVTNLRPPREKRRMQWGTFGIGIQVGYGLTFKAEQDNFVQPRPYVGIGVNYNFLNF